MLRGRGDGGGEGAGWRRRPQARPRPRHVPGRGEQRAPHTATTRALRPTTFGLTPTQTPNPPPGLTPCWRCPQPPRRCPGRWPRRRRRTCGGARGAGAACLSLGWAVRGLGGPHQRRSRQPLVSFLLRCCAPAAAASGLPFNHNGQVAPPFLSHPVPSPTLGLFPERLTLAGQTFRKRPGPAPRAGAHWCSKTSTVASLRPPQAVPTEVTIASRTAAMSWGGRLLVRARGWWGGRPVACPDRERGTETQQRQA